MRTAYTWHRAQESLITLITNFKQHILPYVFTVCISAIKLDKNFHLEILVVKD